MGKTGLEFREIFLLFVQKIIAIGKNQQILQKIKNSEWLFEQLKVWKKKS
jgi:hypothetical protein